MDEIQMITYSGEPTAYTATTSGYYLERLAVKGRATGW